MLAMEGTLQAEEQSLRGWDAESARSLGAMDASITASSKSAKDAISGNSAELSDAIANMEAKSKADAERLNTTLGDLSKDSAAKMGRGLKGAESTLDTEANAIMREEAMLKKTQGAQKAFAQGANSRNQA